MRHPWTYRIGFGLFLLQPLMLMGGVPPAVIGAVSILSLASLIAGLFVFKPEDFGIVRLAIWTGFTGLLIILTGAVFFQVAFALVRDRSCDQAVGYVVVAALALAFTAFLYGCMLRIRKRQAG